MNLIAQRSPSATHSGRTATQSFGRCYQHHQGGNEVRSRNINNYSNNHWLGQELTSWNSQEECYGEWA